jgi:hypothetical protein
MLVASAFAGVMAGLRDRRGAVLLLGIVVVAAVVVWWVVVPTMSTLTGGAIGQRFADAGLRDEHTRVFDGFNKNVRQ